MKTQVKRFLTRHPTLAAAYGDTAEEYLTPYLLACRVAFNDHPKAATLYCTANGQVFFTERDACNHARQLEDKTVLKAERQDVMEESEASTVTHKLTADDLFANPELAAEGLKAGDVIELPLRQDAESKERKTIPLKKAADTHRQQQTKKQPF